MKLYISLAAILIFSKPMAQGFPLNPVNWTLPAGGQVDNGGVEGFYRTYDSDVYTEDEGSQHWNILDMNGDGQQDLVATAYKAGATSTTFNNGSPYWKVYINNGIGFSETPIEWSLPSGGKISNTNNGFVEFEGSSSAPEPYGSENWAVLDMNADNLPDSLVTSREADIGLPQTYGEGNPYWKVYINNGLGFSTTAQIWYLPPGGLTSNGVLYGFNRPVVAGQAMMSTGSNGWDFKDISGDGKPDLIVTSERLANTYETFSDGTPYWKVYLNTGAGFSTAPTTWPLPPGGTISDFMWRGFVSTSHYTSDGNNIGDQNWNLVDISGDQKADLVLMSEIMADENVRVYGDENPYWKVYLNNGSGFSNVAENWSLPPGGLVINDTVRGFYTSENNGIGYSDNNQAWGFLDMDGDAKPDLVVTAQRMSGLRQVFSDGGQHWKVYKNNGTGFQDTEISWSIPDGGQAYNEIPVGFTALSGNDLIFTQTEGGQLWHYGDMNGDGEPDLIVTSQLQEGLFTVFDDGNPYWKVYLNTSALGTDEPGIQLAGLEIFPNPLHDIFTLKVESKLISSPYLVRNMIGEEILSGRINNELQLIDLGKAPAGLYFIEVEGHEMLRIIKR